MEFLIFGGSRFIGWVFSTINNIIDEKQSEIDKLIDESAQKLAKIFIMQIEHER